MYTWKFGIFKVKGHFLYHIGMLFNSICLNEILISVHLSKRERYVELIRQFLGRKKKEKEIKNNELEGNIVSSTLLLRWASEFQ